MSALGSILTALLGYAIGTAQILVLDWLRRRTEHSQHLRAIRSELKRAALYTRKFNWDPITGPKDEYLPRPPVFSSYFADVLLKTNFELTDAYENDKTQEGLLGLLDGADHLQHHSDKLAGYVAAVNAAESEEDRDENKQFAIQVTKFYDDTLEVFTTSVESAVSDLDRRLLEVRFGRQIQRMFLRLEPGESPPALPIRRLTDA